MGFHSPNYATIERVMLIANKLIEEGTFLKSPSSAGSKIGNHFLSSKGFGSGNRVRAQLLKKLW